MEKRNVSRETCGRYDDGTLGRKKIVFFIFVLL